MKLRRTLIGLLILSIVLLTGCGTTTDTTTTDEEASATAEAVESADKHVILAVSFGTSYNDSREKTIGGIEKAIAAAYPDYEVRRAFTSQIIIDKLKERDKIEIDNVTEALDRLVADGVKEVIVQPTHVMSGFEYDDVVEEVEKYNDKFDSIKISSPLLTSDEDYTELVEALKAETAEYNEEGTAIVFMGHGTEHESNATYAKLQGVFEDAGMDNYIVGTVEAEPSLEDVVAILKEKGYNKVVLEPLMVVAGDHANNDMAGDEEDSWKTLIEAEGYEVECVLRGLGEFPEVQQIYIKHLAEVIGK